MYILLFLIGLSIALGAYTLALHNKVMEAKQIATENWIYIDHLLKRRAGLVLALLESARGTLQNESPVRAALETIRWYLRRHGDDPKYIGKRMEAEWALFDTLHSLLALSENYPDLQKNQPFLNYKTMLGKTEEEILEKSTSYNEAAKKVNDLLKRSSSKYIVYFFDVSEINLFIHKA